MGKKSHIQKKVGGGDAVARAAVPLDEQMHKSGLAKQRKRKIKDDYDDDSDGGEQFVEPKMAEKLLSVARQQMKEVEDGSDEEGHASDPEEKPLKRNRPSRISISEFNANDLLDDDDGELSGDDLASDSGEAPSVVSAMSGW